MMSESEPIQPDVDPQVGLGDRHIYDIQFATKILKKRDVPLSNISILIDYNAPPTIAYLKSIGTEITIQNIDHFQAVANSKKDLDNLIVCIYGHGSHNGIDGKINLKLNHIVSAIDIQIKNCAIIFGQCYSGIYNYHDAFLIDRPNICFLGATNFNTSLSSPLNTAFIEDPELSNNWIANIFMAFIFLSFIYPHEYDADGDNKLTLVDIFKNASSLTNVYFSNRKSLQPIEIYKKQKRLLSIDEHEKIHEYNATELEPNIVLEKTSLLEFIHSHYASLYHLQDPWILNHKKAEQIEFNI